MPAANTLRTMNASTLRHRIYAICAKHAVKIERDTLRDLYPDTNNGLTLVGSSASAVKGALDDILYVLSGDDNCEVLEQFLGSHTLIRWSSCSAVIPTQITNIPEYMHWQGGTHNVRISVHSGR